MPLVSVRLILTLVLVFVLFSRKILVTKSEFAFLLLSVAYCTAEWLYNPAYNKNFINDLIFFMFCFSFYIIQKDMQNLKVKCGICGRAMSYKTYSRNGVSYRYFTCPHAKEQTGEDGCCKRYVIEDNLNEIVWSVIRQLLAMTDAFKQKLDKQNNVSRQDNLILAEKLARLQQEKEKCESDRFVNVDQFMVGQLDKEMYQRRRADLGRLAEKLDADIAELEQKLKAAETMKDDSLSQALGVMKKYSGADELTQAMVQELIEKVVVMDLEHVEIVWKFKDEVRNFIGI